MSLRPFETMRPFVTTNNLYPCEGGGLIIVSCPRVLLALDHPATLEYPLDNLSAIFVCIVALVMSVCMGRSLG